MKTLLRNTKMAGGVTYNSIGKEGKKYYFKNAKYRDKSIINHPNDFSKIICETYKKIGRGSIEYEGGFMDDKFFSILPTRSVHKKGRQIYDNEDGEFRHTFMTHTQGYVYKMTFINLLKLEHRRAYDMTRTLQRSLNKAFNDFLKEKDFSYKFPIWDIIRNLRKDTT